MTVTATHDGTGVVATTVTNDSGEFVFPGLRIGTLHGGGRAAGLQEVELRGACSVNVQDRVRLDFELGVGALTEAGDRHRPGRAAADAVGRHRQRRRRAPGARPAAARPPLLGAGVPGARRRRRRRPASRAAAKTRSSTPTATTPPGTTTRSTAPTTTRSRPTCRSAARRWCSRRSTRCRSSRCRPAPTRPSSARRPARSSTPRSSRAPTPSAARPSSSSATRRSTPTPGTTTARSRPKGQFNQHIAGFTLGGPIDARASTFFFGDYQATRTERALSQTATVPTARMRTRRPERAHRHDGGVEPVRAGRLRRTPPTSRINPSCIDPVAARLVKLYPAAQRARRRLLQQQLHLQRHPQQRHQPVRRAASTTTSAPAATTCSCATASSRPTASSRRCSNDPVASGDFASNYLIRGQNAVGRLVARLRRRAVQRVPRRLQPRALRRGAPGVRHRLERRVRHQRRAQGPALLRRAAAHADRALRAARRAVLPAAVPDLAGVPVRREPHLDQGHATR